MFCKSREDWKNMPGGLIQTVLCDENFYTEYSRIDELFYHTMKAIVDRINESTQVAAPIDNGRALVTRDIDHQRMKNWKKRLEVNLKELDVLFEPDCTHNKAIKAWSSFFNHYHWESLEKEVIKESFNVRKLQKFTGTEQFIDEVYPVYEQYDVTIDCKVSGNGFTLMPVLEYLDKYASKFKRYIPYNFSVKCKIGYTNCPSYDKVLWKVLNVGSEAEQRNEIRGQIQDRGKEIIENAKFFGPHYIECYLIKDGICVAIDHVSILIGVS